jgi:DNA-directed RNA polymerase sigma subunit (sigma70/sigma32)
LRIALEIAEARAAEFADLTVLDLAQEGNVGLIEAIQSYQGITAAEFIQHARQCINQHLEAIEAVS